MFPKPDTALSNCKSSRLVLSVPLESQHNPYLWRVSTIRTSRVSTIRSFRQSAQSVPLESQHNPYL